MSLLRALGRAQVEFGLGGDPALVELARMVHAADVTGELATHPVGAGLLATGIGGLAAEADDQQLLARAEFVYDALYAYCQQQFAERVAPSAAATPPR